MLKTILRLIVVAVIAVALGFLIYHLNQPTATAELGSGFSSFSRDLGEGSFRDGRFSPLGGLFGTVGNRILVAVVTLVVVPLQKAFGYRPELASLR